jgi:hypothetical protein
MSILQNNLKVFIICAIVQALFLMPVLALDFDSTVNDFSRKNYSSNTTSPQTKTTDESMFKKIEKDKSQTQNVTNTKLPSVPNLPQKANSSTVAPTNTQYSGKCPKENSLTPCSDIKVGDLIIDESVVKSKQQTTISKSRTSTTTSNKQTKTPKYRTVCLPKGTQIRVVNTTRISDGLCEGQTVVFRSTQEIHTPYFVIPSKTKFTARVISSHRPQFSCNGGLVALRFVSADINGYTQPINASIIKVKTDNIHFGNLKGRHTYWKTTCKKAKWGQKVFTKWSRTSSKLASKGPAVILAPFPYIGGCVTACASTISSPVTAMLGKGGNLVIPQNTAFTIKLYDDAKIRY